MVFLASIEIERISLSEAARIMDDAQQIERLRQAKNRLAAHVIAGDAYQSFLDWRGIDINDVCKQCNGSGSHGYANTSTWHHGIGGQMITSDVCDVCWGSGSSSHQWPSWRKRLNNE